jgi:uncharacterized protein (TIGR03435 family)
MLPSQKPTCLVLVATATFAGFAFAQSAREFDVVSIRADRSANENWSIRTPDGGRFTATGISARTLCLSAFDLRGFQLIGGPNWLDSERYNIVGKTAGPGQITPEEVAPLLQSLLARCFQLKYHREKRELPEFFLTVAKDGPKLTPNTGSPGPGIEKRKSGGKAVITATQKPLIELTKMLGAELGSLVVDKTDLHENYDFTVEWSANPDIEFTLPSLFTALQEQLGLHLASGKGPVEVIVIDSMEKASEN